MTSVKVPGRGGVPSGGTNSVVIRYQGWGLTVSPSQMLKLPLSIQWFPSMCDATVPPLHLTADGMGVIVLCSTSLTFNKLATAEFQNSRPLLEIIISGAPQ